MDIFFIGFALGVIVAVLVIGYVITGNHLRNRNVL